MSQETPGITTLVHFSATSSAVPFQSSLLQFPKQMNSPGSGPRQGCSRTLEPRRGGTGKGGCAVPTALGFSKAAQRGPEGPRYPPTFPSRLRLSHYRSFYFSIYKALTCAVTVIFCAPNSAVGGGGAAIGPALACLANIIGRIGLGS